MRASLFALFGAALAGLTNAYTTPVGSSPSGNSITKPGLAEIVPVNAPYKITWNPTTQGTVTLVLLRGPSTNILPLYPIAEKIENTGSYEWTPSSDLEPDTTHYGIQLIVDSNGQYQYTSQFGISNSDYTPSSSASSSSAVVTPSLGGPVSVGSQEQVQNASAASVVSSFSSSASSAASSASASAQSSQSALSTSVASAASSSYAAATSSAASMTSSGYASATSSYAQVTSSYGSQTTLSTSAVSTSKPANATSSLAASTGAAGKTALHFGGVVAGSIGAAMVLLL